jgi:hypothetical protein
VKAINGIDSRLASSSEAGTGSREENASSKQDGSKRQQGTSKMRHMKKAGTAAGFVEIRCEQT